MCVCVFVPACVHACIRAYVRAYVGVLFFLLDYYSYHVSQCTADCLNAHMGTQVSQYMFAIHEEKELYI